MFKKKDLNRKLVFGFIVIFGLSLMGVLLYQFGTEALQLIKLNINFSYFFLFIFFTMLIFVPYTMRLKVIIDSYGKKVPLLKLIKQTMAGFAVSYVTPASRLGGEPVRIYMLKKENDIGYPTATASVILDKFVEILGSALYGIVGLFFLVSLPGLPLYFKIIFALMIFFILGLLFYFYQKSKKGDNIFSSLVKIFHLSKFIKFKDAVEEIDKKINYFFKKKKKVFLLSFMFYIISGILFLVQFKVLLLSIGVDASLGELILIINIWGLMNFVPVPGGVGFLEASQSGLFLLFRGSGVEGLAMTLLLRIGYLLVVIIGFFFLSHFGIKQFFQKKPILKE